MKIKEITGHQVLDSNGNWTIDANVLLDNGDTANFSVPGGLSRGKYEAVSVSPADAVLQIRKIIAPMLLGKEAENQKEIDTIIENLNVGANASLAVSVAVFKTANLHISPSIKNLPRMIMLMLEGGKHGHSDMEWQEFSVIVKNFSEGKIIYQKLGEILRRENLDTDVGVEGGYSPNGIDDYRALELLREAAGKTSLALDIAGSFSGRENDWEKILKTNVGLIEDPFGQDDWSQWTQFNKKYGRKILVVADDLTVTSAGRIALAVGKKAANGVIIKPNQTTTLTKVFEALETCKKAGLKIIVSHRGTETNDSFIADLALFAGADYVKFGAPVRGERIAKYNRLLELLESRV